MLVNTHEAAMALGGTPTDRPEDIEISPFDNTFFVAHTNDNSHGDIHGHITRYFEKNNDLGALEFDFEIFAADKSGEKGKGGVDRSEEQGRRGQERSEEQGRRGQERSGKQGRRGQERSEEQGRRGQERSEEQGRGRQVGVSCRWSMGGSAESNIHYTPEWAGRQAVSQTIAKRPAPDGETRSSAYP